MGLVGFNIGVDLCLPFFCSCGIYLLLFSVCLICCVGVGGVGCVCWLGLVWSFYLMFPR